MIKCVYKIINRTNESVDILSLCSKENKWVYCTWTGFKPDEKPKCCVICGNKNIVEKL